MSGPIVRKYGFPNFEKIFGERPLEHGLEDEEHAAEKADQVDSDGSTKKPATKKKSPRSKQK